MFLLVFKNILLHINEGLKALTLEWSVYIFFTILLINLGVTRLLLKSTSSILQTNKTNLPHSSFL